MNKPMLFVGDMQNHRTPVLFIKALTDQYPDHRYVFVGDFLDSWVSRPKDQVKSLRFALDLVEKDQADVVWSNHDVRYAYPELGKVYCSGWHAETAILTMHMTERMRKLIKPCVAIEQLSVLVTHAGVSDRLAYIVNQDITPKLLEAWFLDRESPYWWIGPARFIGSGANPTGGPLWCDWNDEFTPLVGVTQVVGHTRQKTIAHKQSGTGRAYNVDCLSHTNTVLELTLGGAFTNKEVTL